MCFRLMPSPLFYLTHHWMNLPVKNIWWGTWLISIKSPSCMDMSFLMHCFTNRYIQNFICFIFLVCRQERRIWIATLFFGCTCLYAARTVTPLCMVAISKEMNWTKTDSVCQWTIYFNLFDKFGSGDFFYDEHVPPNSDISCWRNVTNVRPIDLNLWYFKVINSVIYYFLGDRACFFLLGLCHDPGDGWLPQWPYRRGEAVDVSRSGLGHNHILDSTDHSRR